MQAPNATALKAQKAHLAEQDAAAMRVRHGLAIVTLCTCRTWRHARRASQPPRRLSWRRRRGGALPPRVVTAHGRQAKPQDR
eukprot:6187751-Pleurochrysis_carterae.AAC.2